jgi:cyclic-di-GMP-binding protein
LPAQIALAIRVDRSAPSTDLEVRPKNLKRWIDSLPLEATFESGRKLVKHLAALNRATADTDARLEMLEAHREAATKLLADLEPLYAKADLPLGPKARTALGLARELLTELALGYRITVVEQSAKLLATRKQLAGLLQRAAQLTASRMYAAYKSYTPVPTGTWSELHEIYLRADSLGLAREAADGGSIADLYTEALMLSLTDPYRLGQGEAERVLSRLRGHRGLATLGQARPRTPPGGHFIVPCNTDKPPKPSIGKLDDTGGPDWRLLDTNPVADKLRATPTSVTKAKGISESDLVAKLIRLWSDPPKRTSRRDASENTVAISMGIDGVGHFVALESKFNLVRQDDMLKRGITMPLAPLPVDNGSGPIPVFEWDVVNESKGGLRVRRLEKTEQPIAVGEVAGIKLPGKAHWAIGVVRWITVFEDGGMEFGLQYLAAMARAVTVKGWNTPSATGLLLADEGQQASTLLTTPNLFATQRELELEDGAESVMVKPGEMVEVTHRFEIFRVTAP